MYLIFNTHDDDDISKDFGIYPLCQYGPLLLILCKLLFFKINNCLYMYILHNLYRRLLTVAFQLLTRTTQPKYVAASEEVPPIVENINWLMAMSIICTTYLRNSVINIKFQIYPILNIQ